jgi:hypothetical protein
VQDLVGGLEKLLWAAWGGVATHFSPTGVHPRALTLTSNLVPLADVPQRKMS